MSARALLVELETAGVRRTFAGSDLRLHTRPGVSIAPFRDRIAANKPALLAELLKARIISVATVDPDEFDRAEYERLAALVRPPPGTPAGAIWVVRYGVVRVGCMTRVESKEQPVCRCEPWFLPLSPDATCWGAKGCGRDDVG